MPAVFRDFAVDGANVIVAYEDERGIGYFTLDTDALRKLQRVAVQTYGAAAALRATDVSLHPRLEVDAPPGVGFLTEAAGRLIFDLDWKLFIGLTELATQALEMRPPVGEA